MGRVRFRRRDLVRTTFWDRNMLEQNMLIQDHVLLGKITVTIKCIGNNLL